MALTRPFSAMREDIQRLMNDMEQQWMAPTRSSWWPGERLGAKAAMWAPAVDVIEEEKQIKVKAQVPGIKPEDLDIEVEADHLTIRGETVHKQEEEKGNVYHSEISYGKVFRRIPLPTEVQSEKAKADFEHGMLTITLPKAEGTHRHRIKVSSK